MQTKKSGSPLIAIITIIVIVSLLSRLYKWYKHKKLVEAMNTVTITLQTRYNDTFDVAEDKKPFDWTSIFYPKVYNFMARASKNRNYMINVEYTKRQVKDDYGAYLHNGQYTEELKKIVTQVYPKCTVIYRASESVDDNPDYTNLSTYLHSIGYDTDLTIFVDEANSTDYKDKVKQLENLFESSGFKFQLDVYYFTDDNYSKALDKYREDNKDLQLFSTYKSRNYAYLSGNITMDDNGSDNSIIPNEIWEEHEPDK